MDSPEEPIGGRPRYLAAPSAKLQEPALPAYKRKNISQSITISSDEEDTVSFRLDKGKKRVRTRANTTTNDGITSIEKVPSSLPQDGISMVGLLKDRIDILETNGPRTVPRENRTRDVDQFFTPTYNDANGRKMRTCKKCSKASCPVSLVAEVSTLRRHLESHHKAEYLQWAEANGFTSMLPKDAKQRHGMNEQSGSKQGRLDGYLQPTPVKEKAPGYSDKLFREALVRWIVETDQPISVVENPFFRNMINAASCAANGNITTSD